MRGVLNLAITFQQWTGFIYKEINQIVNCSRETWSWTPILSSDLERRSWTVLLNSELERCSWTALLNSTIEGRSWMALLNGTLERHTWTALLNAALERCSWAILLNSTLEQCLLFDRRNYAWLSTALYRLFLIVFQWSLWWSLHCWHFSSNSTIERYLQIILNWETH